MSAAAHDATCNSVHTAPAPGARQVPVQAWPTGRARPRTMRYAAVYAGRSAPGAAAGAACGGGAFMMAQTRASSSGGTSRRLSDLLLQECPRVSPSARLGWPGKLVTHGAACLKRPLQRSALHRGDSGTAMTPAPWGTKEYDSSPFTSDAQGRAHMHHGRGHEHRTRAHYASAVVCMRPRIIRPETEPQIPHKALEGAKGMAAACDRLP